MLVGNLIHLARRPGATSRPNEGAAGGLSPQKLIAILRLIGCETTTPKKMMFKWLATSSQTKPDLGDLLWHNCKHKLERERGEVVDKAFLN